MKLRFIFISGIAGIVIITILLSCYKNKPKKYQGKLPVNNGLEPGVSYLIPAEPNLLMDASRDIFESHGFKIIKEDPVKEIKPYPSSGGVKTDTIYYTEDKLKMRKSCSARIYPLNTNKVFSEIDMYCLIESYRTRWNMPKTHAYPIDFISFPAGWYSEEEQLYYDVDILDSMIKKLGVKDSDVIKLRKTTSLEDVVKLIDGDKIKS